MHVANGIPQRRFCSVFQLPTGSLTKPYAVIRSSAVPLEWVLIDRSLTSSPSSPPVLALSLLPCLHHAISVGWPLALFVKMTKRS